ncbi:hypothetical protein [Hymenobacter fodinae]|uniref:DUF2157 domain-containing protein n=1 Tax=Hymenobacter fodinae TaxID=2510796 RepID=A0A4Z0P1Z9_9BACT|nr:hypothetical protein [Hymenobacter fodinae]TGE05261.1 hypothetical protein EU556_18275 [Hymenobacter fodinae]
MNLKAYNPAWAQHEAMHAATARWFRRGLLTSEQQQAIQTAYPLDFYRPGLFLRIGLFIFAYIGASGMVGLLAVITSFDHLESLAFIAAIGTWLALEFFIRSSRLYHAGADNALLYMALGWAALWLTAVLDDVLPSISSSSLLSSIQTTLLLGPLFLLGLLATIRFADRVVAFATYCLLLLLITIWLLQLPFGRLVLPFILMAVSAGAYQLVALLSKRPDYTYYQRCLVVLKVLSLSSLYLAGNYYVVREGNAVLGGDYLSAQIPSAPVFYLLTALVPLLYIRVGLRHPSRVWLLTGLAAAAFSLFTLRHYRAVLPTEIAAVLFGLLLILLAVWAARYLRPTRHGLTSLAQDEQPPLFNLESLIVAETAVVPTAPEPTFQFGGGHSGGAGADGTY